MALLLHIVIATASLGAVTYAFFSQSHAALRASYALVALTLASGTYLVVTMHANLLSACASGLAYLTIAACGIIATRARLSLALAVEKIGK